MGPNEVCEEADSHVCGGQAHPAAAADAFFCTAVFYSQSSKTHPKRNIDTKNESPLKHGYFVVQR